MIEICLLFSYNSLLFFFCLCLNMFHVKYTIAVWIIDSSTYECQVKLVGLRHWGKDQMDAILHTTVLIVFLSMETFELQIRFDWNLFHLMLLTISELHWMEVDISRMEIYLNMSTAAAAKFNSLAPGRLGCHFKLQYSILFYWSVSSHRLMIMPLDKCHGTSPMIGQHCFR